MHTNPPNPTCLHFVARITDGQIQAMGHSRHSLAIQDHPVIDQLRVGFYSDEGRQERTKIEKISASSRSPPFF
jgi:hypothetical protein